MIAKNSIINKIRVISRLGLSLALSISVSGCGTIISGTSQPVHVKVVDADTKEELTNFCCTITDGTGGVQMLSSNPESVRISRQGGSVNVSCQKPGYRQVNTWVGDSFNAVTVLNVLFWPGFIVDAATGAYKKLPSHYVINMKKSDPVCNTVTGQA